MKLIRFLKRIALIALLFLPLLAAAQDDPKPTKKQRKADQKKEQRAKDAKKSEFRSKKQHLKLQDKATRKRMKKHKRKGTHYVSTKPNFFRRLFNIR